VNSRASLPAVGRFAPSGLFSYFPRIIEVILGEYLFSGMHPFSSGFPDFLRFLRFSGFSMFSGKINLVKDIVRIV